MAQVGLPTTTINITLWNPSATDNTISNKTNDDAGMDKSAKPWCRLELLLPLIQEQDKNWLKAKVRE